MISIPHCGFQMQIFNISLFNSREIIGGIVVLKQLKILELESLEGMYSKKGFQMAIVYGRRRIGKTSQLQYFE